MTTIAVIGAGIVGLAVSASLMARGHRVHLYDPNVPGEGTSFGNAGLIANYATAPMASLDTLRSLPRELRRPDASLSVDRRYTPSLLGFGRRFLSAATPARFARNKAALIALIEDAVGAQHALLDALDVPGLFADTGCLQIVRDNDTAAGLDGVAAAKRRDGVECRALTAEEVRGLEPELNAEGLRGGVFFPGTRHLKNPLAVSQTLRRRLESQGLRWHRSRVHALTAQRDGGWRLSTASHQARGEGGGHPHDALVDRVVLCAGIANNALLKALGVQLPVVSERGYHISLQTPLALSRPVGWLAHHFYATPMEEGIRLAGTTEFSASASSPDERRWERLRHWGSALFGRPVSLGGRWLGVRHSTPDGLPVIGAVPGHEGLYLAYGHGHLGLTLSAQTGRLIAAMIDGDELPGYSANLSPGRFMGDRR
ncbi:D-amino-acid dehydrogenase [Modicisalibacter muralis]|uniref:D-amino-acid dehydrogenase n=1 Tax=Modicisalibacter muralis TaxID=119000 RepID=A0A1G9PDE4_9GAMM|nr:FAD-dependent oxidoreductase [Halomonas muralis]SDL96247.1 D-amino-acid dehydrogenase [Halomonas muralis]